MARCTKCQTEWTFKDKAKTFKGLSRETTCPYCGEEQFINLKAKKQIGFANMIIPVTMLLPIPFNMPLSLHIPLIIIGIITAIILNIHLVKLSNKEEFPI